MYQPPTTLEPYDEQLYHMNAPLFNLVLSLVVGRCKNMARPLGSPPIPSPVYGLSSAPENRADDIGVACDLNSTAAVKADGEISSCYSHSPARHSLGRVVLFLCLRHQRPRLSGRLGARTRARLRRDHLRRQHC